MWSRNSPTPRTRTHGSTRSQAFVRTFPPSSSSVAVQAVLRVLLSSLLRSRAFGARERRGRVARALLERMAGGSRWHLGDARTTHQRHVTSECSDRLHRQSAHAQHANIRPTLRPPDFRRFPPSASSLPWRTRPPTGRAMPNLRPCEHLEGQVLQLLWHRALLAPTSAMGVRGGARVCAARASVDGFCAASYEPPTIVRLPLAAYNSPPTIGRVPLLCVCVRLQLLSLADRGHAEFCLRSFARAWGGDDRLGGASVTLEKGAVAAVPPAKTPHDIAADADRPVLAA